MFGRWTRERSHLYSQRQQVIEDKLWLAIAEIEKRRKIE